jgi:GMP synthase-like glutamine amidotransferase
MNVLSVIHGTNARGGVFTEVIEEAEHRYEEWSLAWRTPPPRPLGDYEAVIVFGGSMHADQDHHHPWLRDENDFIRDLLDRQVPLLGVCLGIQLMAKAEGEAVYPLAGGPEIGWLPVELTEAAARDPVFAGLPARFDAFGWHYYTYDLPARADELARSARCNQAYRLGEAAWGIQFHAEVTLQTVYDWLADEDDFPADLDRDAFAAEAEERIGAWNELGRGLCRSFLDVADRTAAVAA